MNLSDINKENPFNVPEDYFDNFYDRFQYKLKEETDKKVVKLSFSLYKDKALKILNPVIKIAAILILVFIMVRIEPQQDKLSYQDTEYMSEEDILYNLLAGMDDYTFYEMVSEMDEPIYEEVYDDNNYEDLYLYENISDYELYNELYNK